MKSGSLVAPATKSVHMTSLELSHPQMEFQDVFKEHTATENISKHSCHGSVPMTPGRGFGDQSRT